MDVITARTTEAELIVERAGVEWLAGEAIRAIAPVSGLDFDRWKVHGLDDDGRELPPGRTERFVDGPGDLFTTDEGEPAYVAVRGHYPTCSAVRLYRAAELDHAWLVITDSRLAVLRLCEAEDASEGTIESRFELPTHALASVVRWKQPMMPEIDNGPRFAQIGFADASWARVKTDESGLASLVPPLSHSAP
ncbi:MAG TPA: hypothetical protein VEX15_14825 [Nocardioidaceae bacterium]|nr:hypothetical protein [Nocardioidaceae bacterium]